MTRVFFFLVARSAWNRAARRLRRLREPRYVIGLGVGLAYLYWFIVRQQLRSSHHASSLLRIRSWRRTSPSSSSSAASPCG